MLLECTSKRRWWALALCCPLAACAAPGDPTPINALALGHLAPETAIHRSAEAARSHPPSRAVAAAAVAPSRKSVAESGRAPTPATAAFLRPTSDTSTVAASGGQEPSPALKPVPALVPAPAEAPPAYSPLSPSANPVALVPPGEAKTLASSAHDAVLAPGPSLCSLDGQSTAADVLLNAQPCPVDLRPTLKPGEPAQ